MSPTTDCNGETDINEFASGLEKAVGLVDAMDVFMRPLVDCLNIDENISCWCRLMIPLCRYLTIGYE